MGEVMFKRDDGRAWKRAEHCDRCGGLQTAGISPAVGFHVLRHTHAWILAMQGVPMAVIARQLGHADTRMTEKHYAHLAPNYVADTIGGSSSRQTSEERIVVPINPRRKGTRASAF